MVQAFDKFCFSFGFSSAHCEAASVALCRISVSEHVFLFHFAMSLMKDGSFTLVSVFVIDGAKKPFDLTTILRSNVQFSSRFNVPDLSPTQSCYKLSGSTDYVLYGAQNLKLLFYILRKSRHQFSPFFHWNSRAHGLLVLSLYCLNESSTSTILPIISLGLIFTSDFLTLLGCFCDRYGR